MSIFVASSGNKLCNYLLTTKNGELCLEMAVIPKQLMTKILLNPQMKAESLDLSKKQLLI